MPEERCFVCASNEGVFLDIFAAGKNYRENIETCLSLKISKKKIPSTRICHKCVYELDQCSKFVERYKKTHRTEKGKLCRKAGCCCMCMEPGKTGYIFDLWNKNPLDNSKEKLQDIFKVDLVKRDSFHLSICLNCRYNLDVLFDLKCVFKDTSRCLENILNGNMSSSQLPKISTCVVRRNTTKTRISKVSESKSSDSDASTVKVESELCMPALSSRKSSPQERKCDECNIRIINGMDMYRYHHTGNTVCKECWMTMDPCEKAKNKIRELNNKATKTKLCSVFLKDILSKSLEIKNKDSEIEKIIKDEIIIVSSDELSNDEDDQKTLSIRIAKQKRKLVTKDRPVKKLRTITRLQRKRITRSNSVQNINVIDKTNIRMTRSESAEKSESEDKTHGKFRKIIAKSITSKSKSADEKPTRKSRSCAIPPKKRARNSPASSISSIESFKPTKIRRLSASSKVDSIEENMETDTNDNVPYACKFCDSIFENKIVGLTHELSHAKKLEVVLKKVTVPETIEVNAIIEREPSTEFESPVLSQDEALDVTGDVTNESTLQELSDLPEDDTDSNEQRSNTQVDIVSTDNGNKDKKNEEKTKKNEEEKISDDISTSWSIEGDDTVSDGINDKANDIVNEPAEKTDNITEEIINNEDPSNKIDVNVNEISADNDVAEQSIEITKLNTPTDIDTTESNKKELPEEINENKLRKVIVDRTDEKPENKIENGEKDNIENENTDENVKFSEDKKISAKESEKETISQSEIITNSNEDLENKKDTDINDDEGKEMDSEDSDKESEKVDGITDACETQKSKEEKIAGESSEVSISNGDISKKLSDTDTIVNNDNKVKISEVVECNEESDKSEKCPDVNADENEKKVDNITDDNINYELLSNEADTTAENTEADNNVDCKNSKTELIEIEKNVSTTSEEKKIKESMGIEETALNEAKNTE